MDKWTGWKGSGRLWARDSIWNHRVQLKVEMSGLFLWIYLFIVIVHDPNNTVSANQKYTA